MKVHAGLRNPGRGITGVSGLPQFVGVVHTDMGSLVGEEGRLLEAR